jgi:hypothetical protein
MTRATLANSLVFWVGLIGLLVVIYILLSAIGLVRQVECQALVLILRCFPVAWPAALLATCLMPRRDDRQSVRR